MQQLRILVVDDDRVDRMTVQRALRAAPLLAHVVVLEATTVAEAREVLARAKVDCVLLDFQLPGTSGLELLESIRETHRSLPVVMLTGQGDQQTAVDAMRAGAADYLAKSQLDPERLERSILQAIRVKEAERAATVARERLEAAEQRYRFLAESIPQMVWVTDSELEIEYVNRRWVEYTGLDMNEAKGEGWLSIVHPDDRETVVARWNAARATAAPFESLARLRRATDGQYRWHLSRAEPHGTGSSARWFGTTTDLEEQKRAEAELVRIKEAAEADRLRAEEANRAKDQFLAVLSHELRTPLNSILGWISILRGPGAAGETVARGLATIDRNARAQAQLIEDLLDVSRIVAGKLVIDARPVDIRDIAAASLETVRPMAAAKNIALDTHVVASPLVVHGDGARLQQVIWNLLVNAVKFTPDGGNVVLRVEKNGDRAVVRVADTGEGIAPSFLPRMFDRFLQADASFTRTKGGLGLGLSIVKHLVERHGGDIAATSAGPGQGATFTVSLPLAAAEQLVPGRPRPDAGHSSLRGVDILVVDDDDDSREMLVAALARHGAVIRDARSVAAARRELATRLPDVVVSDIGMPGEDGFALIRELRRLPPDAGGRIPAIALTGYAGLDDQRLARDAGFDHHVSKPVDLARLPRTIAGVLTANRAHSND